MSQKTVIYLHGFASSAGSFKATFFSEKLAMQQYLIKYHAVDFNPTPEDFAYTTVTGQINRLRQYILDRDLSGLILVGSSLGALIGLHYAHRFGQIDHMLLLAPALVFMAGMSDEDLKQWRNIAPKKVYHYAFQKELPIESDVYEDGLNYRKVIAPPVPVTIIHGRHDPVVPVQDSRDYARKYHTLVNFFEVDSDHLLHDQMDFIWQQLYGLLKA